MKEMTDRLYRLKSDYSLESELIKRGWRLCAKGQQTTQWCQMAEDVRRELREVYYALDDIRVDNIITLPEAVRRLREAAVVLYGAISETERSRLHAAFPEQMKWLSGLTLVLGEGEQQ